MVKKAKLKEQIRAIQKAKEKMLFSFPPPAPPAPVAFDLDAKMADLPPEGIFFQSSKSCF